jgi:hypothetical protein
MHETFAALPRFKALGTNVFVQQTNGFDHLNRHQVGNRRTGLRSKRKTQGGIMKSISKVSVLAAVLAATATFASADTIIGSWATTNPGFGNTATVYGGFNAPTIPFTPGTTAATVAITPNPGWAPAGSADSITSQWVSFEAGTGAGPAVVAPNGTYSYFTSFTAAANSTGSIYVLADDTTDVFLNGHLLQPEAGGPNSICQTAQPNCTMPLLVTLADFVNGTNVLEFDVDQSALVSTGLDFYGTVQSGVTPEPSSFILLGSGLLGVAGVIRRRLS